MFPLLLNLLQLCLRVSHLIPPKLITAIAIYNLIFSCLRRGLPSSLQANVLSVLSPYGFSLEGIEYKEDSEKASEHAIVFLARLDRNVFGINHRPWLRGFFRCVENRLRFQDRFWIFNGRPEWWVSRWRSVMGGAAVPLDRVRMENSGR
jgi:hypothetical protein